MFIYVAIKKMNTSRRLMFRFVPFVFINDLRYLFLRTRTEITNERIFGDTKETSVGLEKKKKKKKYRRDFSFRKKRKKKKKKRKERKKKKNHLLDTPMGCNNTVDRVEKRDTDGM